MSGRPRDILFFWFPRAGFVWRHARHAPRICRNDVRDAIIQRALIGLHGAGGVGARVRVKKRDAQNMVVNALKITAQTINDPPSRPPRRRGHPRLSLPCRRLLRVRPGASRGRLVSAFARFASCSRPLYHRFCLRFRFPLPPSHSYFLRLLCSSPPCPPLSFDFFYPHLATGTLAKGRTLLDCHASSHARQLFFVLPSTRLASNDIALAAKSTDYVRNKQNLPLPYGSRASPGSAGA
ncbi:hypothetical protein VTK56DRAFT_9712 [Thermocarpiscus australiensis]